MLSKYFNHVENKNNKIQTSIRNVTVLVDHQSEEEVQVVCVKSKIRLYSKNTFNRIFNSF